MDTTSRRVLFAIAIVVIISILALSFVFSRARQSAEQRDESTATVNQEGEIESEQTKSEGPVQVFFIIPGVESVTGDIGCGDSVRSVIVNTDDSDIIKFALENLFSVRTQQTETGYYNALWQSDLKVGSIDIDPDKVVINIEGNLVLNGECGGPRAQAQIDQTAKVAAKQQLGKQPENLEIYINGQILHEAAGLR